MKTASSSVEKVMQEASGDVEAKKTKTFIITHDFEAAANRCKAKVAYIAAHCRSQNRRYRFVPQELVAVTSKADQSPLET